MSRFLLWCLVMFTIPAGTWAMQPIQHWRTDNGVRVYFVPADELPIIDISIGFDAGAARDPEGKSGLAHMVNVGMREGAGDLDGAEIESRLEEVGANLSNENGRDMSVFELRSLSEPEVIRQAASVLAAILTQPTFPRDAIERERQRSLVALAQEKQSARDTVQRAFFRSLFAGHAYSNPPNGSESGIES
ncbi:MAG: insulinase family protein, partial [Anaerolineales bacterium]|nr:insulinase family protein [Anaerolineales bacterium]